MKYAIVTGASRGLGAAAAEQLLAENYHLVDISRSGNESLGKKAEEMNDMSYTHIKADLSSSEQTQSVMEEWLTDIKKSSPEEILLIQNAGTVEPIEVTGKLDSEKINYAVQLNYVTPVCMANALLASLEELDTRVIIVNITSGAADKPNHGWSIYGSTKAALNLFTETAALEHQNRHPEVKIISFSPSIMDTDMQQVIRSSSSKAFAQVERFQEYKKQGKLRTPEQVASALVHLVINDDLQSGKLYHINDFLN
ncbi:(S)-benzoin forming benzil reductase [Jeotgalibacillus sp. ET6]|uniref:(S)-benzoin forming benzil reductase n=1 Tax=Jeotgalibacillus sp. ET6 TaxID=3037260 RepID=UPI002418BAB2|nr:(S)-benzoin forming benzil reductase [Jeotgalibacillus sp. ET6]MDG5472876.1 (S)-benzoin forming benzil reductase [Jeotgalibacillus sp. ET6]